MSLAPVPDGRDVVVEFDPEAMTIGQIDVYEQSTGESFDDLFVGVPIMVDGDPILVDGKPVVDGDGCLLRQRVPLRNKDGDPIERISRSTRQLRGLLKALNPGLSDDDLSRVRLAEMKQEGEQGPNPPDVRTRRERRSKEPSSRSSSKPAPKPSNG